MVRESRLTEENFSGLVSDFIEGCNNIGGVVDEREGQVKCSIGIRREQEGYEEPLIFDDTGIVLDKVTRNAMIEDEDVGGIVSNPNKIWVHDVKEPLHGTEPQKELIVERKDRDLNTQSLSMKIKTQTLGYYERVKLKTDKYNR